MTPPTTAEICARFRGMYVPAVSDAMYELGLPEPVLPSELRPLLPEKSFVGIAFTLEGVEIVPAVSWDEGKVRIASYLEVFEKLTADSVIVSKNTGNLVGHFGELTGNSAMKYGCVGVVLDGNLRDTGGLREIGLQVFFRDVNPRSGMGRWEMTAFQEPVTIGAVTVHPGDLVIADFDGILVVPQANILTVLQRAEEIIGIEGNVRDDMRRGMSPLEGLAKHGHI
jgi:regulator of RNase E activity RraA